MSQPPVADQTAIRAVSPSLAERLRSCRLKVWFDRDRPRKGARITPAQALGIACHEALESLVARPTLPDDWASAAEEALASSIGAMASSKQLEGAGWAIGDPEAWPGYGIKAARLRKAATRLEAIISALPPPRSLVSEQSMSAWDGRIIGRPDLVIRSSRASAVIDYKTGRVTESGSTAVRQSYVRQLELYAVLEAATSGKWPEQGTLLPLNGLALDIPLERETCERVAADAVATMEDYNATQPGAQPASPSPASCSFCPHGLRCPAVWSAADESWAPTLLIARGVVRSTERTVLGGVSAAIDVTAGNVPGGSIYLRAVHASEHPAAELLEPEAEIALTGLQRRRDSNTYSLPPSGHVAVGAPHD